MGVVYKAHEESLNRFVAIKVLGEHLEEDDEYVKRFVREAQSAAALSHPNIVQIYSISEDQGHHYFAMEYVQGTSVQRMIQTKGKLTPADAARLTLQAAAGLQDAHAQGVIHRDIKPANLMVTDRGLVKIADFGLALMGGAANRLTATGMLMGTPGYLSPEQCLDQSPDQRTDIYSLGVTFFEMVTGTMPFRADSPLALLKLIVEVEAPDIRELNPEVDNELRAIIAQMLEKDREQRFSDCTEVIAAIRGWLEANGESLQTDGIAMGTAAGVAPPPPPTAAGNATEDQINTDPTVVVPSGAADPLLPPAPTAPAPAATAPAVQATAPATQPQPDPRPNRTGLIIAAVAVLMLAGVAIAAIVTVKSGILDSVFNRGEALVAEAGEEQGPLDDASGDAAGPTESDRVGSDDLSNELNDSPDTGDVDVPVESRETPDVVVGNPAAENSGAPSGSTSASEIEREVKAASGSSTAELRAPPPRIVVPPPTGTVVLAVGEQILAYEAESYVKARLESAGVEVVDVNTIPGLEGFINPESRPSPEQIYEVLRPHARYLVTLRVNYLGERQITYMGQRELVYSSRVNMGLVNLAEGRPIARPDSIKVEYNQLNAARVAERDLRRVTTGLLQKLPRE
jgi:serine/threonine-protein kinase